MLIPKDYAVDFYELNKAFVNTENEDLIFSKYVEYDGWEPQSKEVSRKYYLYYFSNASIREVSKRAFVNCKGKLVVYDGAVIKLLGNGSKMEFKKKVKFLKQSKFDDCLKYIKQVKRSLMGLFSLGYATNRVSSFFGKLSRQFYLDLLSYIMNLIRTLTEPNILNISIFLLDIYKFYTCQHHEFVAQSLDPFLLSAGLS